jgi:hypothetical protein
VIPEDSLTIVDRGFLSYLIIFQLVAERRNRHFLCRAKKNTRYEVVGRLPDGTALAFIDPSKSLRRQEPGIPGPLEVRAITYQHPGGQKGVLLTTLIDHVAYPAEEIIRLYHERWELELAFDEVKTDMLERKEALRSKKPEGVYQEVWALLLTYNLVRREMQLTATETDVDPSRISFKNSLLFIRNFFVSARYVSPGSLPKHLGELCVLAASAVGGRGANWPRVGTVNQLGLAAAHSCGRSGTSPLSSDSAAYRRYASGSAPQIRALSKTV